jgi:hypothetical protein
VITRLKLIFSPLKSIVMAQKPFFPDDLPGQIDWLDTFSSNLTAYTAKYGITAVATIADNEWMQYWYGLHTQAQAAGQTFTAFKNEAAFGVPPGSLASVPPVFPVAPPPPATVAPGVFPRALSIAKAIKVHKDYTVADGEALGLEGALIPPPDLSTLRPVLKPIVAADHVDIGWKKNGTEGVEIWVQRGAAAYVFLAVDTTTPKYVDTQPFPATEEKWTYKAIHIFDGGRVGLWSEEVSVQVKA